MVEKYSEMVTVPIKMLNQILSDQKYSFIHQTISQSINCKNIHDKIECNVFHQSSELLLS